MRIFIIIYFGLLFQNCISQEYNQENNIITFDYNHQFPTGNLSQEYGNNSSLGLNFIKIKNKISYGIDIYYMFGNNVKNDSLLNNISTDNGWLINSSGELDTILLYQRGWNSHFLFGRSIKKIKNSNGKIYFFIGLGYLQHKIRLESNRTDLPQIDENYIIGYDKLRNGISTKIGLDYIYMKKNNAFKYKIGIELINSFTKSKRSYDFPSMQQIDNSLRIDKLIGLKFGIIIPINRNNDNKFHYY
tara:strand:+ start:15923 stop:16657 length:735 start_codon:yes stop_codon:yes gene_type:complete